MHRPAIRKWTHYFHHCRISKYKAKNNVTTDIVDKDKHTTFETHEQSQQEITSRSGSFSLFKGSSTLLTFYLVSKV